MKIHAIAMLACLLLAGMAWAQPADDGLDSSGIYFAESADGTSWCTTTTEGSTVTAYLCLTRGTDSSGYVFWEGRLEVSAGGAFTDFRIRGDGTNAASEPEFVVSYGSPLPFDPSLSTVILEMDVNVGWEYMVAMRWGPVSSPSGGAPLPSYATVDGPTDYRTLGYSFGWEEPVPNWCAAINDANCLDGPEGPIVPAHEKSWGDVKSLYR